MDIDMFLAPYEDSIAAAIYRWPSWILPVRVTGFPLDGYIPMIFVIALYFIGIPLFAMAYDRFAPRIVPRWVSIGTYIHNMILAIFSLLMWVSIVYDVLSVGASYYSFVDAFCLPTGSPRIPMRLRRYLYWFYLSKWYETIDTIFLILRHKEITVLHFYHHGIVIGSSWVLLHSNMPWGVGAAFVNTFVHSIMYRYFALTALGAEPWWRRWITRIQMTQFLFGLVCSTSYIYLHYTQGCTEVGTVIATAAFDGSLLLFFMHMSMQPKRPQLARRQAQLQQQAALSQSAGSKPSDRTTSDRTTTDGNKNRRLGESDSAAVKRKGHQVKDE